MDPAVSPEPRAPCCKQVLALVLLEDTIAFAENVTE